MAFTDNSLDAVCEKLTQRLITNILLLAHPIPDASIKRINAPFTTPNNAPWIRLNINNFGPIDQDASGCYEINRGIFDVFVFYPKGTGSRKAFEVAQSIKSLYTAEIFDDVVIESVLVNPTSEPDSSPWYGTNVQINYTFEGHTS